MVKVPVSPLRGEKKPFSLSILEGEDEQPNIGLT